MKLWWNSTQSSPFFIQFFVKIKEPHGNKGVVFILLGLFLCNSLHILFLFWWTIISIDFDSIVTVEPLIPKKAHSNKKIIQFKHGLKHITFSNAGVMWKFLKTIENSMNNICKLIQSTFCTFGAYMYNKLIFTILLKLIPQYTFQWNYVIHMHLLFPKKSSK